MIIKTMVDIAEDILKKEETMSFDNLWEHIKTEKKDEFELLAKQRKITVEKLYQTQIAELYTILTVDGRFLRLGNADWALGSNFSVEEKEKLRVAYAQTSED